MNYEEFWKIQHDRIKSILDSWSNYGHTFEKKYKEVCHENNELRKENQRLRKQWNEANAK